VALAKTKIGVVTLLIVSLFPATAIPQKSQNADGTANALARRVLMNELKAEDQDHSHWVPDDVTLAQAADPLHQAVAANGRAKGNQ